MIPTPQVQSPTVATSRETPASVEKVIAPGEQVEAKVRQATTDPAKPDVVRVKLEARQTLLQITAQLSQGQSAPQQGQSILLSRTESGQLNLTLPKPILAQPELAKELLPQIRQAAATLSRSQPAETQARLNQLLPIGTQVDAKVLPQPTSTAALIKALVPTPAPSGNTAPPAQATSPSPTTASAPPSAQAPTPSQTQTAPLVISRPIVPQASQPSTPAPIPAATTQATNTAVPTQAVSPPTTSQAATATTPQPAATPVINSPSAPASPAPAANTPAAAPPATNNTAQTNTAAATPASSSTSTTPRSASNANPAAPSPSPSTPQPVVNTGQGAQTVAASSNTVGTAVPTNAANNAPTQPTAASSSQAAPAQATTTAPATPTAQSAPATAQPTQPTTAVTGPAQLANLQPASSQLALEVAGQRINLQAPANMPALTQVQVTRTEGQQVNLQWQAPATTTATSPTASISPRQLEVLDSNLRQALPNQLPVADGLQQLSQLTSQLPASNASQAVDKVVQSLLQLFGVRPGSDQAPETIRQNVQQGGLLTEQQMARGAVPQQDLKALMGKINKLSEQLPKADREALQSVTQKVLSRITANQAQPLQQQARTDQTSNERYFQLDLPVIRHGEAENIELRIGQRESRNEWGELQTLWRVQLHFDLQESGELDADIALNPEDNQLSASFYCSDRATLHSLQQAVGSFRQQLGERGFEVQSVNCSHGKPKDNQAGPVSKRLVDIRT